MRVISPGVWAIFPEKWVLLHQPLLRFIKRTGDIPEAVKNVFPTVADAMRFTQLRATHVLQFIADMADTIPALSSFKIHANNKVLETIIYVMDVIPGDQQTWEKVWEDALRAP